MNEIILAIQQLFENSKILPTSPLADIKTTFYGEPNIIGKSNLPAIVISPGRTDYVMRGSRYDQKNHSIIIKVIYSLETFLSQNPNQNTVEQVQSIIKKVEDTENQQTKNLTICGLIQKNIGLPYNGNDTCSLSQIKSVSYGFENYKGIDTYQVGIQLEAAAIGNR